MRSGAILWWRREWTNEWLCNRTMDSRSCVMRWRWSVSALIANKCRDDVRSNENRNVKKYRSNKQINEWICGMQTERMPTQSKTTAPSNGARRDVRNVNGHEINVTNGNKHMKYFAIIIIVKREEEYKSKMYVYVRFVSELRVRTQSELAVPVNSHWSMVILFECTCTMPLERMKQRVSEASTICSICWHVWRSSHDHELEHRTNSLSVDIEILRIFVDFHGQKDKYLLRWKAANLLQFTVHLTLQFHWNSIEYWIYLFESIEFRTILTASRN